MNPPTSESAAHIITLLASLMLVLQLLLVVQRMLVANIHVFAMQSLLLTDIAGVVG
jgi:hydrogenase-4 membrane subunit HyfE